MGRDYQTDSLKIISMNSSGRTAAQNRKSMLEHVIGDAKPHIMFLPGDQPDMKSPVLSQYKQATVTHNNDTVLLYDTNKLRIKSSGASGSLVIPDVDINKILFPSIEILAPQPTKQVVKEFQCVTWHYELTQTSSQERFRFAERYVWLAQYLAFVEGVEVLIAGDFNLPLGTIKELLDHHNKLVQDSIDAVKPFFQEMGFLDDMTDNVHRPQRRLRQLKLHKCKANQKTTDTEYFVASKEMQLCKTETLEKFEIPGCCASIPMCNERPAVKPYCSAPTATQMNIPARPPRHNGG